MHQFKYENQKMIYGGLLWAAPFPPNYAQRLADSAACWSVDQVALSLWLRHWSNLSQTPTYVRWQAVYLIIG